MKQQGVEGARLWALTFSTPAGHSSFGGGLPLMVAAAIKNHDQLISLHPQSLTLQKQAQAGFVHMLEQYTWDLFLQHPRALV